MARLLRLAAIAVALSGAAAGAQAGNPLPGYKVYSTNCSVCHSNKPNAAPGVGPPLFGVVGRKAGTAPGFKYSPAMKAAGFVWTPDQLKRYIAGPKKVVPGNRMPFDGLQDLAAVAQLVEYLATLK